MSSCERRLDSVICCWQQPLSFISAAATVPPSTLLPRRRAHKSRFLWPRCRRRGCATIPWWWWRRRRGATVFCRDAMPRFVPSSSNMMSNLMLLLLCPCQATYGQLYLHTSRRLYTTIGSSAKMMIASQEEERPSCSSFFGSFKAACCLLCGALARHHAPRQRHRSWGELVRALNKGYKSCCAR